jgi:hypothetical protein
LYSREAYCEAHVHKKFLKKFKKKLKLSDAPQIRFGPSKYIWSFRD